MKEIFARVLEWFSPRQERSNYRNQEIYRKKFTSGANWTWTFGHKKIQFDCRIPSTKKIELQSDAKNTVIFTSTINVANARMGDPQEWKINECLGKEMC